MGSCILKNQGRSTTFQEQGRNLGTKKVAQSKKWSLKYNGNQYKGKEYILPNRPGDVLLVTQLIDVPLEEKLDLKNAMEKGISDGWANEFAHGQTEDHLKTLYLNGTDNIIEARNIIE